MYTMYKMIRINIGKPQIKGEAYIPTIIKIPININNNIAEENSNIISMKSEKPGFIKKELINYFINFGNSNVEMKSLY